MKRRDFIKAIAGFAALWPVAADAQQADRLRKIGFLGAGTPEAWKQWVDTFVQRLQELGWIEGRTIAIEFRWAEGRQEHFAEIATEFVRLKVDVIVTSGTSPVIAAKRATSTIPIVFATAGDPVGAGLVASLARPAGNVTGVSNQFTDLAGKRVELLHEVVPGLGRLAILGDHGNPSVLLDMDAVAESARTLGMQIIKAELRRAEDIVPALAAVKNQAQALYIASGPLVDSNRVPLNTLALAEGVPTMHGTREQVEAGGLMSYGANRLHQFRRAAEIVDKVLRGASPANIPIEQPTQFELVINLKTAKALGLTIAPTLLARADNVIE
jgi:putative tryptophan/tyrosine transport system substrate-binding protein